MRFPVAVGPGRSPADVAHRVDARDRCVSGAPASGRGPRRQLPQRRRNAGGDFHFRLNVLPVDVNGSGSIFGTDVTLVRNRQGTRLPAAEPTAPAETTTTAPTMAAKTTTGTVTHRPLFATSAGTRSGMRLLAQRFDLLGEALETPLVA